jgi:hypothetical protein
MNVSSMTGNAQAVSAQPMGFRTKVRVAGWFVMSVLLLITAVAVVLNRFDLGYDEAQASDIQREVAPSPTDSHSAVDARDILDDAQRETPRSGTAPTS